MRQTLCNGSLSLIATLVACPAVAEVASLKENQPPVHSELSFARELKDMFRFSGFGTLGVAGSDEDRADFVSTITQPHGPGYTRDWTAALDSRLGVQLTFLPTDKFSAVVQVTTEQEWDNSWEPDIEWAFVQYDLTSNLSIRAGRMVVPLFMFSEFRKVGFALPWVRPPGEFYFVPYHTSDGLGVLFKHNFGDVRYTFYGTYGQDDSRLHEGIHSKWRQGFSLSNTFEYKDTSFRASYSSAKMTFEERDDALALFKTFGPQGDAIYDEFSLRDREYTQLAFGIWHNPGKWFAGGEWSRGFSDSYIQPGDTWYITSGYRFNKLTPYLMYSKTRRDHGSTPQLSGPPATVGPLNDFLFALTGPLRQSTITVGTRWDFAENAAFKVQLDHIMTEENSNSLLWNVQPDFDFGDSVNVLSFTVDFVF